MKKYIAIIATLVLLLLVFAPATYAQEGDAQGGPGGPGGGPGWDGGWQGGGWQGGGWGGGWDGGWGGGWHNCQGTCYRVRYGDTLFSIGRRYGVNPWEIARVNSLPNPNCIYAGQWLIIPPSPCCWQGYNPWPQRPYPYDGKPAGWYGGGWGPNDGWNGGGWDPHGYDDGSDGY